jgi:DNA-directed RNA polymerase subunit RPC12/RpoP
MTDQATSRNSYECVKCGHQIDGIDFINAGWDAHDEPRKCSNCQEILSNGSPFGFAPRDTPVGDQWYGYNLKKIRISGSKKNFHSALKNTNNLSEPKSSKNMVLVLLIPVVLFIGAWLILISKSL